MIQVRLGSEPDVHAISSPRLLGPLQADVDKKAPPGTKVASVPLPDVARSEVPVQPSEQKARTAYQNQIANFNDSLLSIDARFELA